MMQGKIGDESKRWYTLLQERICAFKSTSAFLHIFLIVRIVLFLLCIINQLLWLIPKCHHFDAELISSCMIWTTKSGELYGVLIFFYRLLAKTTSFKCDQKHPHKMELPDLKDRKHSILSMHCNKWQLWFDMIEPCSRFAHKMNAWHSRFLPNLRGVFRKWSVHLPIAIKKCLK